MASVLPLVAAAAVSASVYASLHSTLRTFGTVSNSAENITAATAMMRSVSDGESAIRGFALIGSPALVRRYRDAVKSFDEAADRLDPGASESASQRETIAAVRGALRNWQRHFAERIVQIRDDMPASLSALIESRRLLAAVQGSASSLDGRGLVDDRRRWRESADALQRHLRSAAAAARATRGDTAPWDGLLEQFQEYRDAQSSGAPHAEERLAVLDSRLDALITVAARTKVRLREVVGSDAARLSDRVRELLLDHIGSERDELNQHLTDRENSILMAKAAVAVGPLAGVLLTLAVVAFVSRGALRSIGELTAAAGEVAGGNFERRVPVSVGGDLGSLAEAFNAMAGQLAVRERQSELLDRLGETLMVCADPAEAYRALSGFGGHLFPGWSGAVLTISASRNLLECMGSWGHPGLTEGDTFTPRDCWALRHGRAYAYSATQPSPPCPHVGSAGGAFTAALCVPVLARDEVLGILHLVAASGTERGIDTVDDQTRRLAVTVAEQLGLAVANLSLREALRNQSIRDHLTGLFNRR
jgi:GAF domain-containing protein/CHASE3 domain sensor protein